MLEYQYVPKLAKEQSIKGENSRKHIFGENTTCEHLKFEHTLGFDNLTGHDCRFAATTIKNRLVNEDFQGIL